MKQEPRISLRSSGLRTLRFTVRMMWFLATFQKEIASLTVSLIVTGVGFAFKSRVELIWSSPHSWNFLIQQAAPQDEPAVLTNIYTAAIFIQNIGRLPASEVELTFNWEPPNWNIWPLRAYSTHTAPDRRFTLKFDNFAPREILQIELLSNTQLPVLSTVRSKESVGKHVQMIPSRVVSRKILYLRWMLLILGISACFYLPMKLVGAVL